VVIIWIGVQPKTFFESMGPTVNQVAQNVNSVASTVLR